MYDKDIKFINDGIYIKNMPPPSASHKSFLSDVVSRDLNSNFDPY